MITLTSVTPDAAAWVEFLSLSYDYVAESWPMVAGAGRESFLKTYDRDLRGRLAEGGRGLFLFKNAGRTVGLANVYIGDQDPRTVHVAEFNVVPAERRSGAGRSFLALVEYWGCLHGATAVSTAVDKIQPDANRFWSAMGMVLDDTGERNLYRRRISGNSRI